MVESKLAPARWMKRVHVDITQALAVLWSHCLSTVLEEGDEAFQGKCYVFRDPRADSGQRIVKPHDHSLPSLFRDLLPNPLLAPLGHKLKQRGNLVFPEQSSSCSSANLQKMTAWSPHH